jgi:hypothetical protein
MEDRVKCKKGRLTKTLGPKHIRPVTEYGHNIYSELRLNLCRRGFFNVKAAGHACSCARDDTARPQSSAINSKQKPGRVAD